MKFERRQFCTLATFGALPFFSGFAAQVANAAPKKGAKPSLLESQQEALGGFIAGFLITANATVGLVVDATEGEKMEPEEAAKVLGMTVGIVLANKEIVEKLSQYDEIGDEDKKFFIDTVSLFKSITEVAGAAETYWKSEDEADLKKFEKLRKACTAKLEKLFSSK